MRRNASLGAVGVADVLQDWCENAAALLADELPKLSCGGFAVNHRQLVIIDIFVM